METRTVWVEDLACCGDPFAVGSTVIWYLHVIEEAERHFLTAVFGADIGARFTDGYTRHGGSEEDPPVRRVKGVVRTVRATSWQIHPLADDSPETDALGLYALPGSVRIVAQSAADTYDRVDGRDCFGYIVDLEVPVGTSEISPDDLLAQLDETVALLVASPDEQNRWVDETALPAEE